MNNSILKNSMQVNKDPENKKMTIIRHFDASREDVWKAWTTKEILDLWWAPKPWKAETKTMDFREGGHWLYAMVGPDNTRHWARADYGIINPEKNFSAKDSFCDENGVLNNEAPSMNWKNSFEEKGDGTEVTVEISFDRKEDLQTILEMGFEEGFTAGLNQLEELLAKK